MGYYLETTSTTFTITALEGEQIYKAWLGFVFSCKEKFKQGAMVFLTTLLEGLELEDESNYLGYTFDHNHGSSKYANFEELLKYCGFSWDAGNSEEFKNIRLEAKMRDQELFLLVAAPYIKTPGIIGILAEDQEKWYWAFNEGKMKSFDKRALAVSWLKDYKQTIKEKELLNKKIPLKNKNTAKKSSAPKI